MVSIWWQWLGALERAAQRARAGEGATFIDCQIFRLHPHMIYSEMAYVDEKELSAAEAAEPLSRLRHRLASSMQDELGAIERSVAAEVEVAYGAALACTEPPAVELCTDIYADAIVRESLVGGLSE